MSSIDYLKDLYRLRQVMEGRKDVINTSQLETDFLHFSMYQQKKTLLVVYPELYPLEGEQAVQYGLGLAALAHKEQEVPATPAAIDISGGFAHECLDKAVMFVSVQQYKADHYSESRSDLNPLIEKIYTEGTQLLQEFTIHEAVLGKVKARRGSLLLDEIAIFPEKFLPGPYSLSVELDTPGKTIRRFRELNEMLNEFYKNPKRLVDGQKVDALTTRALELRKVLGSLSRYHLPPKQEFVVTTNSYLDRNEGQPIYHLYAPEKKKNIIVHFGDPPFTEGKEPKDVVILDGNNQQATLLKLVECDIFQPSMAVLSERINSLRTLYETAKRSAKDIAHRSFEEFDELVSHLEKARIYLQTILNPDMRKKYVMELPPELIEFMVYPATKDPVVHDVLPKLSWNNALRIYYNTEQFTSQFEAADAAERKKLLQEVSINLVFLNQQNNDVNRWLYENYSQFCVDEDITFKVIGSDPKQK